MIIGLELMVTLFDPFIVRSKLSPYHIAAFAIPDAYFVMIDHII